MTALRSDMDDKPLDLTNKSSFLNKESDLPFTKKQQESFESLRLTSDRSVSYKKEFSKLFKQNETLEERASVESKPSSKTSKRYSIPKCGEKILGSWDINGRIRSDESANNSGAKRRKSFDSTSDTKNKPVPTRLANPNSSDIASENCISPRPSTSFGSKSSYDSKQVHGNLTKINKKTIFVCEYCSKVLPCMSKYKEHVRFHTGDKPFGCQYCVKRYFKKDHLDVHVRVHTGERPYVCKYCDKKFSTKWQLGVHIHVHTGERPYLCQYCGRAFTSTTDLKSHSMIHTGEKPYKCTICGRDFRHRTTLKKHKGTHQEKSIE